MSNRLADRLLLSRRDLDVTQEDLAAAAGNVSPAYISSLERGKVTNPTVEVVEALAEVLGVRPDYLLGWTDDSSGEDLPASLADGRIVYQVASPDDYRRVQNLLDIFNELAPPDQQIILDLAERLRRAGNVHIIGNNT